MLNTVSLNETLVGFIVLGMASGLFSTTVAQSRIFRKFRLWVASLRPRKSEDEAWFFGELVRCPYCLGHWVSAVFTLWYWGFNPLAWLAVTCVSVVFSGLIGKLQES